MAGLAGLVDHGGSRRADSRAATINSVLGIPRIAVDDGPCLIEQYNGVSDLDPVRVVESGKVVIVGQCRRLAELELLAQRWTIEGPRALAALMGDFAVAVWNGHSHQLVLARAPLSSYNLAWSQRGRRLTFSTLAVALAREASLDLEFACRQLGRDPLFGSGETAFQGVRLVEPGCYVSFGSNGEIDAQRFWRASDHRGGERIIAGGQRLRGALERAVECAMPKASPVAAHLSAGRDSGAVVATAARLLDSRGERLSAFTAVPGAGFAGGHRNRRYDEGPGAAATAALYGNVDHHLVQVRNFELGAALDAVNRWLPGPYGTPANLPWWSTIQQAAKAQGSATLLTGSAGNLTISAGGPWALVDLPGTVGYQAWLKALWAAAGGPGASLINLLNVTFGARVPIGLYKAVQVASGRVPRRSRARFLRGDLRDRVEARDRIADPRPPASFRKVLEAALEQSDGADVANEIVHGITLRDPTADREVVESLLGVAADVLASPYDQRPLFEAAFGDRLPARTLRAPVRAVQGADWNTATCLEELSSSMDRYASSAAARDAVDITAVREALEHWPRSTLPDHQVTAVYTCELLPAISLASFLYVHCPG